jgi:xanthine/CO dehydrogenase XdhC/CoxF family maturation factor
MKEVQEILERLSETDEKTILATVVDVKGSSYRLPGARMLISSDEELIGMISGGCLEADLLERIKQLDQLDKPFIFLYDTTKDENSVFSLNMGCKGIIRVLVESISQQDLLVESFRKCLLERKKQVIATLLSSESENQIGGRIRYSHDEGFTSEKLKEEIFQAENLRKELKAFFNQKESQSIKTFKINQAEYEFFIEKLIPPVKLLVFGAGYDALPVVKIAKQLGWAVSIIDHRQSFASKKRFPEADEILIIRPENLDLQIFQEENLAVVIMTHNYEHDKIILEKALQSDCFYIGMLGSRKRIEKLLSETDFLAKADKSKLYSPIGLDLGADTPETIALSIIAEIQAVLKERNGTSLRNQIRSIYERYRQN